MDITGEIQLPARREVVFAALNDPEMLRTALPGCETLTRQGDTLTGGFDLAVAHLAGPVAGRLTYGPGLAGERVALSGGVEGSHAGALRGSVEIVLSEAGEATRAAYAAHVEPHGALAGIDAAELAAAARDFAAAFFGALAVRLGEPLVAAPPLATETPEEAAQDELVDRLEHRVDDNASHVAEIVEEVEQEIEVAAGRGFLGGPYVWGLIALLVVIVALAILR